MFEPGFTTGGFGSSKNRRNHFGQKTIKPYGGKITHPIQRMAQIGKIRVMINTRRLKKEEIRSVNFLNQSVTDFLPIIFHQMGSDHGRHCLYVQYLMEHYVTLIKIIHV